MAKPTLLEPIGKVTITAPEYARCVFWLPGTSVNLSRSLTKMTLPFVGGSIRTEADTDQYPFGYVFGRSNTNAAVYAQVQQSYRTTPSTTTSAVYSVPKSLMEVTVTGGNILYGVFYNCSFLTKIVLPDGITDLGERAFFGCAGLTSLEIPSSVIRLGAHLFDGCTNASFDSVVLPAGLKEIGESAFRGSRINKVYYASTVDDWCMIRFADEYSNPLGENGGNLYFSDFTCVRHGTLIATESGYTEEHLLKLAYALEKKSEHPLAGAVVEAARVRGLQAQEVSDFRALPGNGLTATLNGSLLQGGSETYILGTLDPVAVSGTLREQSERLAVQGKTPLFFAEDGRPAGIIAVADVIKEDSAEAVHQLQNMGIEVVMLTGDNERTARAIGDEAGVDRVIAGVLPDGKESVIRRLQQRGKVAMVGDGINDAPALTRADIGIAIGAGTDVAIDSADVVLMNSRLTDVAAAIRLSRATLRNIHENLFWAFFYNAVCIPLAAGLFPWKMNPMIGAAAMSLSSFTVCMNALRLNLFRMQGASHDRPMKKRALPAQDADSPAADEDAAAGKGSAEKSEKPAAEAPAEGIRKTLRIDGMMCHHCENAVKNALEKLDFIEEANADFEAGTAVITLCGEADEDAIRKAVAEEDYEYLGMS